MKKTILLLLVLLIIYAIFFTEKDRLDREVKRLCAIDGGIKVYEKVKLPASSFDKYEQISIPYKEILKPEHSFYYESSIHYLKKGNPDLYQLHFKVYRVSGNKLLGESISYTRRGGDISGPWHHSSFGCPGEADITHLKKQIFIKD